MMDRKLRLALFTVVALVQIAVAGGAIVKSELTLRTGEVFRFRIRPVDPVDAFRGRYVAIRFVVESAPVAEDFEIPPGRWVFVPLQTGADGYATFATARVEKPVGRRYLRLRAGVMFEDDDGRRMVSLVMTPFGRYYMDEGLAPEAGGAVWGGPRGEREAFVSVRVLRGVGVIEELYIDGVPIHQWLAENADE